MGWPDGTVKVGEVFYARLPDARYERCVLGPNGERGGTGEFFTALAIPGDDATAEEWAAHERAVEDDANEMIMDADKGMFVILIRERGTL